MTRQRKMFTVESPSCLIQTLSTQSLMFKLCVFKNKERKIPLFIKIFRFLSGMNLTGVNGELTVWNALICLSCRNTGSILTILCLLCFNSTHYSGILSDLI